MSMQEHFGTASLIAAFLLLIGLFLTDRLLYNPFRPKHDIKKWMLARLRKSFPKETGPDVFFCDFLENKQGQDVIQAVLDQAKEMQGKGYHWIALYAWEGEVVGCRYTLSYPMSEVRAFGIVPLHDLSLPDILEELLRRNKC